ncbi:MAG TPA: response regulator [Burkholderiales bacterium]
MVTEANFTSPLRVLVADDHRDTALTLGILLRSEGYDVRLAHNGTEALSEAAQFHPDIALLDLEMPGRTGFEVADELRRRGTVSPVLIAVTSQTSSDARQIAETSGFHHFLAKPYDRQALLLLLASLSPENLITAVA